MLILVFYSYVLVFYSYSTRMYSYFTRIYSYVTRVLLVCTCMLLVCYWCVLVCYTYVLVCYSYVLVCYSYVLVCTCVLLVCDSYVTGMYSCGVLVTIQTTEAEVGHFLYFHCNNFFYKILITCSLFKIFNFVSYANITGVTSHHIMSFQKSVVFLIIVFREMVWKLSKLQSGYNELCVYVEPYLTPCTSFVLGLLIFK